MGGWPPAIRRFFSQVTQNPFTVMNMLLSRFTTCLLLLAALLLAGCTGLPEGITPVRDFDIQRYLGKWYEIARLDHRFERGMNQVTAEYTLRDDGGIEVINRGYVAEDGRWKTAIGKAYFTDRQDTGHLKVSFFGPFYASYVIFELDHAGYQYAFVTSHDKSYVWLLSRTPIISEPVKLLFLDRARQLGFPIQDLIFVDHFPKVGFRELIRT
jgi:apolipoprotein D and lipocalin family protein